MSREQRRLAAIVSADVAGYSRLMGRDESGTLAALKALRRDVVDPPIAAHGGRIVKTTGDGLLLEFPSVVDAVRCVVEVQTAMAAKGADLPEDRRITFRIGVNIGDIIIDADDIFGDGVNIAARLQEIAPPGGVCLSSRVHDDVRDRLEATFEDGGAQALKNIARPVHVWRWSPGADGPPVDAPLALPDKPSIAVLPFTNMSGDPEQEYFADGMVEDIITGLSKTKALFVIARNSSFTYKGKAIDIQRVGSELGVRYVLEGSVRRAGNRLRITGQLIDAANGTHVWADRFDGDASDIFDLQDTITSRVIVEIMPSLERAEIERARRKTIDLQAYDLFLRAMAGNQQQTRQSIGDALVLLGRAIALDPTLAVAHSSKASCHFTRQALSFSDDPALDAAEAEASIRQAFALDPNDPRILTVYGQILTHTAGRIGEGIAHLDHALELDTNNVLAWMWRGGAKVDVGDGEEAIADFRQAMRLSPRDPWIWIAQHGMAKVHFRRGEHAEALRWEAEALRLRPNFVSAHRIHIAAHALMGNLGRARELLDAYRSLDPNGRLSTVRAWNEHSLGRNIDKLLEGLRLAGMPE